MEFSSNYTPIHLNTCGLMWIRLHPNKTLIGSKPNWPSVFRSKSEQAHVPQQVLVAIRRPRWWTFRSWTRCSTLMLGERSSLVQVGIHVAEVRNVDSRCRTSTGSLLLFLLCCIIQMLHWELSYISSSCRIANDRELWSHIFPISACLEILCFKLVLLEFTPKARSCSLWKLLVFNYYSSFVCIW